jgi:hypothetical protein
VLTIFTTAKPFEGHTAIIQRNALKSWTLLHPDAEVALFGDDEGSAEVCEEFGIRHEPLVRRDEHGLKFLDYLFGRAQEIAAHPVLCYANCDIMLMSDLLSAVLEVARRFRNFLMVGRRWDTDVTVPWNFDSPVWQAHLRQLVGLSGQQRDGFHIDYFVFNRGLFTQLLPLVIGRIYWDRWLIWKARSQRVAVVDASRAVTAVHQNHDYSYHPSGALGVWHDEAARRNRDLAGGEPHLCANDDATHRLGPKGIEYNWGGWRHTIRTAAVLRPLLITRRWALRAARRM